MAPRLDQQLSKLTALVLSRMESLNPAFSDASTPAPTHEVPLRLKVPARNPAFLVGALIECAHSFEAEVGEVVRQGLQLSRLRIYSGRRSGRRAMTGIS